MITKDKVQGHWTRRWIKAPGVEDTTTLVHWIQVGDVYADVRIPEDRPDLGRETSLHDVGPSALLKICEAEGFAGTVTLSDDTCTWHREVNLHGTPDGLDIGRISFDSNGDMIEEGVLAEYTELWAYASAPRSAAFRLSGGEFQGVLSTVGDTFVLAIDKAGREATAPLIATLQTGKIPSEISDLFEGIYAMGAWDGSVATAKIATQPFSERTDVLTMDGGRALWHRIDFAGKRSTLSLDVAPI
ncbi:MAG: hypothetical protein AAGH70_01800 [Pseudomonadota bacterium]